MEWTIPETITAGFVIVFALGIIYKFIGQRTDPKLLELVELITKTNADRDSGKEKTQQLLAEALDRNTATLDAVQIGIQSSFSGFGQIIQGIMTIPETLNPAIETLAHQIEIQHGNVATMNNTVDDQSANIQKILNAIQRIESSLSVIVVGYGKLGDDLQDTQKQVETVKEDVSKLKPATPKPKIEEDKKSL